MAITSVKTGSSFTNLQKYDSFLAGNAAYDPSATFLIQRVAGTGASGTITFSSIPSTYKHLQIRTNAVVSTAGAEMRMTLNGDNGTNYTQHYVVAFGPTSPSAGGSPSQVSMPILGTYQSMVTTYPNVAITNLIDYASTTKNKTMRNFAGQDKNATGGDVILTSSLWLNTAAISSVTMTLGTGNFTTSTTIALYGMKG